MKNQKPQHSWSGWPGAFCLNCGVEDPTERAVALDQLDPYTDEWIGTPEEKAKYDLKLDTPCKGKVRI